MSLRNGLSGSNETVELCLPDRDWHEFGQAFLPHRSPFLVTDVLVNTLGASTVLA
jgi:VanZ family protein